ncbi:MAG: hypothetical protein K0R19_1947 [Bacillota bacterium]|nr:hypothetical protein [Bacillota bacterium]
MQRLSGNGAPARQRLRLRLASLPAVRFAGPSKLGAKRPQDPALRYVTQGREHRRRSKSAASGVLYFVKGGYATIK